MGAPKVFCGEHFSANQIFICTSKQVAMYRTQVVMCCKQVAMYRTQVAMYRKQVAMYCKRVAM